MYAANSNNMTQTYDRNAKSEKQKAKSEKRKAKSEKQNHLEFDDMNVCIWHELFDWRKTLTHCLTHSLTHSLTHVLRH